MVWTERNISAPIEPDRVEIRDGNRGSGHTSFIDNVTYVANPKAPQDLSVDVATSGQSGILNWDPPKDPGSSSLDHYNIYRGTSSDSLSLIDSTTDTSTTDTNLTCDQTYHYYVTAVNEDGLESQPSNTTVARLSSAGLDVSWAPENPKYASSAPATPTLGYEDSSSQDSLGKCPEEKTVEFSINTGAFGQYAVLNQDTVPLHLDLNAHVRIPSGSVSWTNTTRPVAEVQAKNDGTWTTVDTLNATPKNANQSATAWNITQPKVPVPTEVLSEGENRFRVVFAEFPVENKTGWNGTVDAARLELAAPPTFILHGWTSDPDAALTWDASAEDNLCDMEEKPGLKDWQCNLRDALKQKSLDAFGQNPWIWATQETASWRMAAPLFDYNPKQGINQTVADLDREANSRLEVLNWEGAPSFLAHSMGGLVARTYSVAECPSSPEMTTCPTTGPNFRAERIITLGTPHLGSHLADAYTCSDAPATGSQEDYTWEVHDSSSELLESENEGAHIMEKCNWHDYYLSGPQAHEHCEGFFGCSVHQTTDAGAYKHADSQNNGLSYLADFQIKTQGPEASTANTFLRWLNKEYAALDATERFSHFAIAGDCDFDDNCPKREDTLENFLLPGNVHDGLVPGYSAVKAAKDADLGDRRPHLARNADSTVMSSRVCVGSQFSHNNLHSEPEVQALALAGLADTVGESEELKNLYRGDCSTNLS
jgi:hypothetical protein